VAAFPAAAATLADDLLGRCAFPPPGGALRCGVSGGADSLALLALAVRAGVVAEAVHVDHGLRPGSAAEAEVVRTVAAHLGAGFLSVRVEVGDGPDLEARARRARHGVLGPHAALGHTADDQAETVLGNLLRGAGLPGVAAMTAGPRHPILRLRRYETEALCAAFGWQPVHDPSNDDPRFRRNRIRHEVLPLLADVASRDVVPLLCRHAELAADALAQLEADAAEQLPDPTDARALAAGPPTLAALAVHGWLRSCSDEGHPPDSAAVERVLAVARGAAVAAELPGGWRVRRHAQRLRLEQPGPPQPQ
jgi:tRNA(Ile)-lysidine synthase